MAFAPSAAAGSTVRQCRVHRLADGLGLELRAVRDGLPVYAADHTLRDPTDGLVQRKIGLSLCSGCAVGCAFCFTRRLARFRPLTAAEIVDQAELVLGRRPHDRRFGLKFALKQMGDPLINPENTLVAVQGLSARYPGASFTVSTSGACSNLWFFDRLADLTRLGIPIRLQFSCHTTSGDERDRLFPRMSMLTLAEIADLAQAWPMGRVTLNFVVMRGFSYDAGMIAGLFRPQSVFIKVNRIDRNRLTVEQDLVTETEDVIRRFETDLARYGFTSARRLTTADYIQPTET